MRVVKKIEVEEVVKEIHLKMISDDFVNKDETGISVDSPLTLEKLHEYLKMGVKVVLIADEGYKQFF